MASFILEVQELRNPDVVFRLNVHWYSTIKDIKDQLHRLTNEPPSRQHIYFSTNPTELKRSSLTLHDIGVERGGCLRVAIDYNTRLSFSLTPIKNVRMDDSQSKMIDAVINGLKRNKDPTPTDEFEGTGGVYFLRSSNGAYCAVFKPFDEEQGMPNNPKDHAGTGVCGLGLREFFLPGQGCFRELAAYIMDYQNFCKVPTTTLVNCEHPCFHYPSKTIKGAKGDPFPKLGSLQHFVRNGELFEDIGPSLLSDFEVQKIAMFDIRILNCDRNAANILAVAAHDSHSGSESEGEDMVFDHEEHHSKVEYELIPIDHGYCMPPKLCIYEWDWVWLSYPQVSRPVTPELKAYINSIDIAALLTSLKEQVNISEDCLYLLEITHNLLRQGVNAGLTLKEIAQIIVRANEEDPSRLETALASVEDNAVNIIEIKNSKLASAEKPPAAENALTDDCLSNTPSRQNKLDAFMSISEKKAPKLMLPKAMVNAVDVLPPIRERGMSELSTNSTNSGHGDITSTESPPSIQESIPQSSATSSDSTDCEETADHQKSSYSPNGLISSPLPHDVAVTQFSFEGAPIRKLRTTGSSYDVSNYFLKTSTISPRKTPLGASSNCASNSGETLNALQDSDWGYDVDTDCEVTCATPEVCITTESPDLIDPPSLLRVSSFAGFQSSPQYNNNKETRNFGYTRLDRRRAIASSEEFFTLRKQFALDYVSSLVGRQINKKRNIEHTAY